MYGAYVFTLKDLLDFSESIKKGHKFTLKNSVRSFKTFLAYFKLTNDKKYSVENC